MKTYAYTLALLIAAASLAAHAETDARPRLIVAISVDQFSADLFAEYRSLFTSGLKRLQSGAVFPSGYQSHASTETCPGHSTLLTGLRPARTGIIANEWYDLSLSRPDKKVYCAEDPTVPGSSSSHYSVSAHFLNAKTLGDRLKALRPQARVVSVAGKDRAAVMMGGHSVDELWYFSASPAAMSSPAAAAAAGAAAAGAAGAGAAAGAFVSWPAAMRPAPKIIETTNAAIRKLTAAPVSEPLPAACQTRAVPLTVAGHVVGVPQENPSGNTAAFRTSLAFDRAISDTAIGMIRELELGRGSAPDVLAIGLSATDYVGHAFGTEGAEMCAQLLGVDDDVGRILEALDATHVPYVVVLTADHGGHDLPERNQIRGMADAARVDANLAPGRLGLELAAQFDITPPVLIGAQLFGDIYLSRDIPQALRPRVLDAARAKYLSYPQVAAVFTAAELARMPPPAGPPDEWTLAERFLASFDPARSGDLLVALKPHVTPIPDARQGIATHGSPWNYDRRVPILFYRPGWAGFEQPLPVETVDIMPTLAALIGVPLAPGEVDGHCLDLDPGPRDTCKP